MSQGNEIPIIDLDESVETVDLDAVEAPEPAGLLSKAASLGQSAVQGTVYAAEAVADNIPFGAAAKASAASQALIDQATDVYFGNEPKKFSELYDSFEEQHKSRRKEVRQNNSISSLAGDAGAIIAPGMVVGKALKGVNIASKLPAALKGLAVTRPGLYKAGITALNASADAGVILGQNSVLQSNDVTNQKEMEVTDTLDAFMLSVGLRGMGNLALAGGKATSNYFQQLATEESVAGAVFRNTSVKAKNAYNKLIDTKLNKGVPKATVLKETDEIITEIGMKNTDNLANPEVIKETYRSNKAKLGAELGDIYESIDSQLNRPPIDTTQIKENVVKKIQESIGASRLQEEKVLNPALEVLQKEFYDSSGQVRRLSLSDAWSVEKGIRANKDIPEKAKQPILNEMRKLRDRYSKDFFRQSDEYAKRVTGQIDEITLNKNRIVKELAEAQTELKGAAPEIMKEVQKDIVNYQGVLQKYDEQLISLKNTLDSTEPVSMLARATKSSRLGDQVETTLPDVIQVINKGKKLTEVSQKYSRYADFESVIKAMEPPKTDNGLMGSIVRGLSSIKTVGAAVLFGKKGAALKLAADTIKPQIDNIVINGGPELAKRAQKVSSFLNKSIQLADDPFMTGLTASFVAAVESENLSDEELYNEIVVHDSKANMYVNPINRTTESAKSRINDLMIVAEKESPELYGKLRQALELDEAAEATLPEIMDGLSKVPQLQRFFAPGQGWDGVLYGQDRLNAATEVMKRRDISSSNQRVIQEEIMNTGKVPDMTPFERKPKVYQPRNKEKKLY